MHVPVADRHLFLISRDQPGLWDYLRREFSSEENVEVILDRRLGATGDPGTIAAPSRASWDQR